MTTIDMTVHSTILGVLRMRQAEAKRSLDGRLVALETSVIGNGTFRILSADPVDSGFWKCRAVKVDPADYDWDAKV